MIDIYPYSSLLLKSTARHYFVRRWGCRFENMAERTELLGKDGQRHYYSEVVDRQ